MWLASLDIPRSVSPSGGFFSYAGFVGIVEGKYVIPNDLSDLYMDFPVFWTLGGQRPRVFAGVTIRSNFSSAALMCDLIVQGKKANVSAITLDVTQGSRYAVGVFLDGTPVDDSLAGCSVRFVIKKLTPTNTSSGDADNVQSSISETSYEYSITDSTLIFTADTSGNAADNYAFTRVAFLSNTSATSAITAYAEPFSFKTKRWSKTSPMLCSTNGEPTSLSTIYSPEVNAIFDSVTLGNAVSDKKPIVKTVMDRAICALKIDGIWDILHTLYTPVFSCWELSRVNWKDPSVVMTRPLGESYVSTSGDGMTFAQVGVGPDRGVADTKCNPNTLFSGDGKASVWIATKQNDSALRTGVLLGAEGPSTKFSLELLDYTHAKVSIGSDSEQTVSYIFSDNSYGGLRSTSNLLQRDASSTNLYGTSYTPTYLTHNPSPTFPNKNLVIGALLNETGGYEQFLEEGQNIEGFAAFSNNITERQHVRFNAIMERFFSEIRSLGVFSCDMVSDPTPTYDPDAEIYFGRLVNPIDDTEKGKRNAVFSQLKSEGLWEKLDVLFISKRDSDTQNSVIRWKGPTNAVLQGAATQNATDGFVNTASSGNYVDTQFIPSTHGSSMTATDSGYYIYATGKPTASTSANYMPFAVSSGPPYTDAAQIFCTSGGEFGGYSAVNGATYMFGFSSEDCEGLIALTRTSISRADLWKNGSSIANDTHDFTGYGVNLPNRKIPLFATLDNATYRDFTAMKIGMFAAGKALTGAEQSTLKTILEDYFAS